MFFYKYLNRLKILFLFLNSLNTFSFLCTKRAILIQNFYKSLQYLPCGQIEQTQLVKAMKTLLKLLKIIYQLLIVLITLIEQCHNAEYDGEVPANHKNQTRKDYYDRGKIKKCNLIFL